MSQWWSICGGFLYVTRQLCVVLVVELDGSKVLVGVYVKRLVVSLLMFVTARITTVLW